MDIKAFKTEIIENITPICALLELDCLELAFFETDNLTSFVQKKYNSQFPFLGFHEIIENETFKNNSDIILELKLKSENHNIFCMSYPILINDKKIGHVFFQKSKQFNEQQKSVLASLTNIFSTIELYIPQLSNSEHKYKDELNKMRTMQAKLFPKFQNIPGLDVSSVYLPVELMSGNFVDAKFLDDSTYQIAACGITGYDSASSFTGASIRTLLHSFSSSKMVPSALIELVIDRLKKMISGIHALIYLTVYQINVNSGKTRVSSYGDISTIYYNSQKKGSANLANTQIGKDLAKRNIIKDISFTFTPGDALLYYSKGILNAETPDGKMLYGESRVLQNFIKNIESSAVDIVHEIADTVYEFTDYTPLNEDILLIAIKKK